MSEIRLEASFSAKPEHVYAAFTNEVMLNNWMGNSSHTEVRVNGYYTFYWQVGHFVSGLYSAVDPANGSSAAGTAKEIRARRRSKSSSIRKKQGCA